MTTQPHRATTEIHAGEQRDPTTGALNTPIYESATFAFESAQDKEDAVDDGMAWVPGTFFYSRTNNPTTAALEDKLAALEGAETAAVQSAGMAACASALMSVLSAGDHLVASSDLFIVTRLLMDDVLVRFGVTVDHVDATDIDAVTAAIRPETKAIFVESLSNPHMDVADIGTLAALAHERGLVLIVDNTFMSPGLFQPIGVGADLVVHSATKYIGGHGDALGGVVAGRRELVDRVRFTCDALGTAISPFNSWLLLRGLRTLSMRMAVHSANALRVAEFLEADERVEHVAYPGLASHPHHELAAKQFGDGFGGMMAIRLVGGEPAMAAFAAALEYSAIAVSLGDVHSLVYPMPKRNNLIRLSVGCEDIDDLLDDYRRGLDAATAAVGSA